MNVFSSRDLKDSLDSNQIVTAEDLAACLTVPAKSLETTDGCFEYSIRGEGPPVLIAHGGPGGYDQGLVIGELFRKNGFQVIAPSRPGYLGTPLRQWKTAKEQGDFLSTVLEALNFSSAIVVGVSGGGPAAYQLAQNYPAKVNALISIDCIAKAYTKADDINPIEEWMYLSRPGQWLMGFFSNIFLHR